MAECINCDNEYSDKRAMLGYKTCTSCGEFEAISIARNRRKRLAPLFNKGAYQYITNEQDLKCVGRKI